LTSDRWSDYRPTTVNEWAKLTVLLAFAVGGLVLALLFTPS